MSLDSDLKSLKHSYDENRLAVGEPITEWVTVEAPQAAPLAGRFTILEPLNAKKHGAGLHAANKTDAHNRMWTYLPYGPFVNDAAYFKWLADKEKSTDPLFFCITDKHTAGLLGLIALARIDTENGSIEVAHLAFSPKMQRTVHSTEAIYLLLSYVFSLGYRRVEWKCNALNTPSISAAMRVGFTYEGLFRHHMVQKGRNRDTCWFSITHEEWPTLSSAFNQWISPANIDEHKIQKRPLTSYSTLQKKR